MSNASPNAQVTIFGIRHHGPGSARSLCRALEQLQPDAILVEGPPDAAEVLPWLTHSGMQPPVALLIYAPDQPRQAVYYPFAVFSPEWQALQYGLSRGVPIRFMDLPQAHRLAVETEPLPDDIRRDPLRWLAEAAGYSDGERWWEHMVEHRRESAGLFAAILEAMTALRERVEAEDAGRREPELLELQREAHMRQTIRTAQREGFQRIAVVCGAWHAPALARLPAAKEDAALLKGLPKTKVAATWVPWTHGRLTFASGYGAGIESPGWYQHLWDSGHQWEATTPVSVHWMTRTARLLREEDLDASAAHVIEAVRLAESLAALRDRTLPGLAELSEATRAVFCFDSDLPMRLIHGKLIVGETLGRVPDDTPAVPLQQDLQREQKRLRLPPEAGQKPLDLDLRKPTDLERSHLLHRLALLGVGWGEVQRVAGKAGTFHELWKLQWKPEFAIHVIEAAAWGNMVESAAAACARAAVERATELPPLTDLLERLLLANLPETVAQLMSRLSEIAAVASDLGHLMTALPPLANVTRYGNVRQTDAGLVGSVVDGLVTRICIGLPVACASLNDDAAAEMYGRMQGVHGAIGLLANAGQQAAWQNVLRQLADQTGLHGLVAGRCCRWLLEAGVFDAAETARRLGLALSTANEPVQAAAWVEGLLKGSGLLLLHDDALWNVLDGWLTGLNPEAFTLLLALLRRTFATFPAPERRQMGERAKRGLTRAVAPAGTDEFDATRGDAVLPLVAQLLGLKMEAANGQP
jgi:hypothetical protein